MPTHYDSKPTVVWRITPGEKSGYWDECRSNGCIAIGWADDDDFRKFGTQEDLNRFLMRRKGRGQRSAGKIWQFVREIEVGHIIVANGGERRLLGIGRVQSGYMAKSDPNNPMAETGSPHARRVDWIEVPENPIKFEPRFFGYRPRLLEKMDDADWQRLARRLAKRGVDIAQAISRHQDFGSKDDPFSFPFGPPLNPEYSSFEARKLVALRAHFQRDAQHRERKIQQVLDAGRRLACEVEDCGFDFEKTYGDIGRRFAHVHHEEQLARRARPSRTSLHELHVVCPNCHAMIHRYGECRTLAEITQYLRKRKAEV